MLTTTEHEIAHFFANGSLLERYTPHVEADPNEEWEEAIKACEPGETVVRYVNKIEVDRFRNL